MDPSGLDRLWVPCSLLASESFWPNLDLEVAVPLEPIASGEEFDLKEGQDNISISKPKEPESLGIPQGSSNANSAFNIFYFFKDVEFPDAEDEAKKVQRACKICLWV